MEPSGRPAPREDVGRGDAASDEELFDRYSALVLEGTAPPPDEFLASHPTAGAAVKSTLARMFQRSARNGSGDALPFERIGEFRLLRKLGGGGMGLVYLAVQESLGREVALKILPADFAHDTARRARFDLESRATSALNHISSPSTT